MTRSYKTLAVLAIALGAQATGWAAPPSPPEASEPAVTVGEARGNRAVVSGNVAGWAVRLPVMCFEPHGTGLGLLLFEGVVTSVAGDQATVEVLAAHSAQIAAGARCLARWQAESILYGGQAAGRAPPPTTSARDSTAASLRHHPPAAVKWGQPVWFEASLAAPVDKVVAMWRADGSGPFHELALEPRGDGLFAGALNLPDQQQPAATVQYYLVAVNAGQRTVVFAQPAEPATVAVAAGFEVASEQLVAHGPVDRASHGQPIELVAQIHPRFVQAYVYYRARGSGAFRQLPMQATGNGLWRAELAARDVVSPGLAYYIAVSDDKGVVRAGFASATSPHHVQVLQPQILSDIAHRNRISGEYHYTDYGSASDYFHRGSFGLERLFFGFLVARLSAAAWTGQSQRTSTVQSVDGGTLTQLTPQPLRMYLGRAGLDVHMGDYVAVAADLDMASYRGGAGVGYRVQARIGDEHVASIALGLEQVWDTASGASILEVKRGTLLVPLADGWRLAATAAQETILTDAPRAIRVGLGIEWDLGTQLQLSGDGGAAGRRDVLGPTGTASARLKF